MKMKCFLAVFFFLFIQYCSQKQEIKTLNIILEKELEIGVEEGDENYMFAGIIDVEVDSKENIYVLDWKNHTVKKYNEDGKFIQNIGQRGQGPGEFSAILVDSFLDRNDRLYVLELLKVHIFNQNGEFIHSFVPDFFPSGIMITQEDSIILIGPRGDKIFHVYSQEAKYLESFGERFPSPSLKYKKFRETWGPTNACLSKDEKIYFFNPFKYEIYVYKDKKLVRKISREVLGYDPPEVTQTGESSYSYSYTPTAILESGNELLAYYSPKVMRENGKGYLDIYEKKNSKYLGSIEVRGYPSAVDSKNHIYFQESMEVPKVIKYKMVYK